MITGRGGAGPQGVDLDVISVLGSLQIQIRWLDGRWSVSTLLASSANNEYSGNSALVPAGTPNLFYRITSVR